MLPVLVPLLRRDMELAMTDDQAALLMRMSAATIDRKLAGERAKLFPRGRSHTKSGTLRKSQIPVRTWAEWDDAVPGFVEIDLVGHEGGNSFGEFGFTLTATDISTGWTVNRSVRNEAAARFALAAQVHAATAVESDQRCILFGSTLLVSALELEGQQFSDARSEGDQTAVAELATMDDEKLPAGISVLQM